MAKFSELKVGDVFSKNGNVCVKRSSRTAAVYYHPVNEPPIHYFKQDEQVSRNVDWSSVGRTNK